MKRVRINNGFGGLEEVLCNKGWVGKIGATDVYWVEDIPTQKDTWESIAEKAHDSIYVPCSLKSEQHFEDLSLDIEPYFV